MEIALPLTNEWVRKLATAMEANTHCSVPRRISKILSATEVEKLFTAVARVLKREKTLVRVRGDGDDDFDEVVVVGDTHGQYHDCLLYTSPSPRDATLSRMPSSA